MSEQTHEDEALEDRLFNKLYNQIHGEMDMGGIKSQIKRINERVETMRLSTTPISSDTNTWLCIGSGAVATKVPYDDDDPSIFGLQQDLYSILSTASWRSLPFWFSMLVIFGFQYLLVILLLDFKSDILSDTNKLNLPANVETSVRIGQGMVIIIALFRQRDLLDGIELLVRGFPDHFRGDNRFVNVTRLQWRLSAIVQLIQGFLNFSASFVLANQSRSIADVLLKVLGISFVSDLDELAFRFCKEGYFGASLKTMSKDVSDVKFHRSTVTIVRKSIPEIKREVDRQVHIIGAIAFCLTALGAFSYFAIRQEIGVYSVQDIRIEFGDEVLPFLGLFNGCYRISESNEHIARRLVYEQVGYPNGGKFGFCPSFGKGPGGWAFYIGDNKGQDEICENYILRSGSTLTFDLLEAGKTKWYTYNHLPIDYLEITENKAPGTECGQKMFDSTKDACPSVLAFGTMHMTKLSPSANVIAARSESTRSLDAAFSHPIYYSNNNGNGSFALTFFTGRRWIRTNSSHIHGLGKETSVSHMQDFFFERNGLFKVIDQLRTSVYDEVELVSAVSEIVDTARDQGTPLGLLWYWPRYGDKVKWGDKVHVVAETETDILQRNFPSANLARPIDTTWTCLLCNNETNPCYYGGICDTEKGTCECKHGATGNLCQEPPLGNGICNLYFNTAVFNYDGGDCCGGTCKGKDCGKDDLLDPFLGLADSYVDDDGWFYPFLNKTEEWREIFRGRKYAYGVDIVGNEDLAMEKTDPPLRFNHCIDSNSVLLTLEQKGIIYREHPDKIALAETTVRCHGSPYLEVKRFVINKNNQLNNNVFKEEVRVPYGARCEFRVWDDGLSEIAVFAGNSAVAFVKREGDDDGAPISVRIPESECVWDAFVKYQIPPEFTGDQYEEFAGGVDLDAMCKRDEGEILDRFAVWRMTKSLSNGGSTSQNFNGHICDKQNWGDFQLWCSDDGLRVSEVWDIADGDSILSDLWSLTQLTALDLDERGLTSLPSEIGRLSSLERLNITGNHLTSLPSEMGGLISLAELDLSDNQITSLPSEMGALISLAELDLRDNQLTSLPSEMGALISLAELDLENNQLTWMPTEMGSLTLLEQLDLENNELASIPSEMGRLKSLKRLALDYNPMTWDSLPIEVQDLESEGTEIFVCDFNFGEEGCVLS